MNDWPMLVAVALSPLIAVWVGQLLQNRKAKRDAQLHVFATIVALRHQILDNECVRAMNLIEVVFSKDKGVRTAWQKYMEIINQDHTNPNWVKRRADQYVVLIHEMAKVLGYARNLSQVDLSNAYLPRGLGEDWDKTHVIMDELIRVLKASKAIEFIPNDEQTTDITKV